MNKDNSPGGECYEVLDSGRELMAGIVITHDYIERINAKPGAEHWVINDVKFAEIRSRIVEHWAARTKTPTYKFPYRDDYLKHCWITFRKHSLEEKEQVRVWCGLVTNADYEMFANCE